MEPRLPVVLAIDVEPDERLVQPTARPRWSGFEALLPEMCRCRARLAQATGAAVQFCWMIRVDHQIERAYGQPDWALERYRREIDELRAQGDAIGLHAHAWRWDETLGTWVANHGDPAWIAHCVQRALGRFQQATGHPVRVFSHGDRFLSNDLVRLLDEQGVRCDLTLVPGSPPRPGMVASEKATGGLPDYRGLPRVPYRPSPDDYRKPGLRRRRRLWLLPLTSGLAIDPLADPPLPEHRSILIGASAKVNGQLFNAYWDRFPLSVISAVCRTDVLLDPHNADQFRRFIDFLADHPRKHQLLLTTPEEAIRIYRQRLRAQGMDRRVQARYVWSTRFEAPPQGPTGGPPPAADNPARLVLLEREVLALRQRLQAIEHSRWWRLRRRLLQLRSLLRIQLAQGRRRALLARLLRALLTPGCRNLRWAVKTVCKHCYLWLEHEPVVLLKGAAAGTGDYARWLGLHAPRPADLAGYREHLPVLRYRPRISVLLPVFDPRLDWFCQAVQSVIDQVYPDWELCIADDASTDPRIRAAIVAFAAREPRIRYVLRPRNGHIAAASNSALELATGEYVAFLDHDDRLAADALYHNVLALNRQPDLDVLYSDEDKLDAHGRRCEPHFKPQWSPDTLLAGNYITHLLVARTELVRQVGGFREGFEGAQDYDLVLRLTERSQRIHHIPRVLYHWRKHPGSTSQTLAAKPYAVAAGKKALQEALERRGEPATVIASGDGRYLVRYALPAAGRTCVIIPTRDQAPLLASCLRSLFERTAFQDFQVLLVDNGSRQPQTFELFDQYRRRHPDRFAVLRDEAPFNFSRLVNRGVRATDGPYVLLLNNDVEAIDPDWLAAMLEQAQRPAVGCVGACLLYPDGTIQHAGVVVGRGGLTAHVFQHADHEAPGYANRLQLVSNYSAVTGACLLVRRAVFDQVGGFDEGLAVDFNDVDFCLRVREAGYHNLVVPHATLRHHESASRGSPLATPESRRRLAAEQARFQARWAGYLASDPCLSPHLTPRLDDLKLVA